MDSFPHTATARLGLVLPSVNTVVEAWLPPALPQGVSLHVARMLLPDRLTAEAVRKMDSDDGRRAVLQVASCRPKAILYGCFASSVVQGLAYDRSLVAEFHEATGLPGETAAGASIAALRSFGAKRIAVISPYADEVDKAEHDFLQSCGFSISSSECFGIRNAFDLADAPVGRMIEAGKRAAALADAIFLSCMNMKSHLAVQELEEATGRPVVTATTATAWALFGLSGVKPTRSLLGALASKAYTPLVSLPIP